MLDLSKSVTDIINNTDVSKGHIIVDPDDFLPMIKEIVLFIRAYEPEENKDYLCFQANYDFCRYLKNLRSGGNIVDDEVVDATIELLQYNLHCYFGWSMLKPSTVSKYMEKIFVWLQHRDEYVNPTLTMSVEYIEQIFKFSVMYVDYIANEYTPILNQRLNAYYSQDTTEGAMSGSNNKGKINACHRLLREIGASQSEFVTTFKQLMDRIAEIEEEELNK